MKVIQVMSWGLFRFLWFAHIGQFFKDDSSLISTVFPTRQWNEAKRCHSKIARAPPRSYRNKSRELRSNYVKQQSVLLKRLYPIRCRIKGLFRRKVVLLDCRTWSPWATDSAEVNEQKGTVRSFVPLIRRLYSVLCPYADYKYVC